MELRYYLISGLQKYDGTIVKTKDGQSIRAHKVIWAAGIKGNYISGLSEKAKAPGHRIKVDQFHKVLDEEDIYAIGDIAWMTTIKYPNAHPQVAQVAIQQSKNLAFNLIGNKNRAFRYKDYGSMATIGRNKAVADLPSMKTKWFFSLGTLVICTPYVTDRFLKTKYL